MEVLLLLLQEQLVLLLALLQLALLLLLVAQVELGCLGSAHARVTVAVEHSHLPLLLLLLDQARLLPRLLPVLLLLLLRLQAPRAAHEGLQVEGGGVLHRLADLVAQKVMEALQVHHKDIGIVPDGDLLARWHLQQTIDAT